jgi:ATP-dependent Lon protease
MQRRLAQEEAIKVSDGIKRRGRFQPQQSIFENDVLGDEWDNLVYAPMDTDIPKFRRPHLHVFSGSDVADFESGRMATCDKDAQGVYKNLVERLKKAGSNKQLAIIPGNWIECIDLLRDQFPNFLEVIDSISDYCQLTELGDRRITLLPMLLSGPPGVGKTEFVHTFAQLFGVPFKAIGMASAQTGAILTGTDSHYSNTQPGELWRALALGFHANPIILLDELDKVSTHGDRARPDASLHELLERRTAKCFRDLSIPEIPADCSAVSWIALCNDHSNIEAPLLSRFTLFHIPAPDRKQSIQIARSIYDRLLAVEPWGAAFAATRLRQEVAERIADLPPRAMKKAIHRALAAAARDGRREIMVSDIADDARPAKRAIGFVA